MANVVADKLTQANQIKEQIRTAANAKNAGIPEGAPFADYPGYLEGLPEQLENVPITLDFSGGDQTITAADGTVVKSAVIQKPANLIPENIAEGVDIAGIVGALASGGGEGEDQPVKMTATIFSSGIQSGKTGVLMTAEQLETINFSSASKKFVLVLPVTGRVISTGSTQYLALLIQTNFDVTASGSTYYYGAKISNYYSSGNKSSLSYASRSLTYQFSSSDNVWYNPSSQELEYNASTVIMPAKDYMVIAGCW